jgi:hypothetical protein
VNENSNGGELVPNGSNAIAEAPRRSRLIISGMVGDALAVASVRPAWTIFRAIVGGVPTCREFFGPLLAEELWGRRCNPNVAFVRKGSEILAAAGTGSVHLIGLNLDHLEWDLDNGGPASSDEDIFYFLSRRYINVPVIGYRKSNWKGPPASVHPWHGVPISTMEFFRRVIHGAVARGIPQT